MSTAARSGGERRCPPPDIVFPAGKAVKPSLNVLRRSVTDLTGGS